MRFLDRVLQRRRNREALRFLPDRVRLIDVGAFHGELFRELGDRLIAGFGIEPLLPQSIREGSFVIAPGFFPAVRPETGGWDAITMLAVLEHVPASRQAALVDACYALLCDGGRMILTVPAPLVDPILAGLRFARLIDGMSLEEHHGFRPAETPRLFAPPRFRLVTHERFQLGLNHLFVFARQSNDTRPADGIQAEEIDHGLHGKPGTAVSQPNAGNGNHGLRG